MRISKIIVNGLRGFAIFFSTIWLVELFRFFVGITNTFNIEIIDFYNSLLGLLLFILISITQELIGVE